MLKGTTHRSFRSRTLYSRQARQLLQSNLFSVLLLALLFLYSSWCYQSLKRRVDAERLVQQTSRNAHAPALPAEAGGLLFSWGLDAHYRLGRMGGDTATPQMTLPQLEVVSIAASRHTLLLTRSGQVWSMGANDSSGGGGHGSRAMTASGQLGRGGGWPPGPVLGALQGHMIKAVAAGRFHSVAVTAEGAVFTWGLNDWGQLGRPAAAVQVGPSSMAAASASGLSQRESYSKDERLPHHKLLSEAAMVESGSTSSTHDAQPGSKAGSPCYSGWSCHDGSPGLITALANVAVVAARAGRYSSVLLDASGQLWVMGFDGCATAGQLPHQEEAWRPRLVQGQLQGRQVVAYDVGYTFWLAATADGALFTCDTQDDGYAGTLPQKRKPNHAGQLGRSGPPHEPGQVRAALLQKSVVAVAAGREHALVATTDGQVYSFGGGSAVLGREGPHDEPGLVTGALDGQFVDRVAAGEYFSLAATDSMVFGWGSNAYLCTGTGDTTQKDVLQPTTVAGPLGTGEWTIQGLAAGYQHAFAIADQPGSPTIAKMRAGALAAVAKQVPGSNPTAGAVGALNTAFAPVEVILTEQQKLQRQAAQQALAVQQDIAAAAPLEGFQANRAEALHNQEAQQESATASGRTTAGQQAQAAPGLAAAVLNSTSSEPARNSSSGLVSTIAASTSNRADRQPEDYHWSYLAQQGLPERAKVHELWASWQPRPWHDALVTLSPDVFKLLPREYNTMHKNPCWGGLGPQLACLPYFNIIGVSKCGTTDLYHRLTLYKQAILPATNKGPHFWDECPFPPKGACQAGPSGDFQAYINLFSRAADLIRSRPDAITGEASSNTFTSANGVHLRGFKGDLPFAQWAGAAGANATMPALLREAQPYLRLILMLRNPVTRYYSAYHYYRWWLKEAKPPTPDDFHDHAVREMQQWQDCVSTGSTAECVRRYKPEQLVKGMYAAFLPDWLQHWPRRQLLIIRYEDYVKALPQHLQAVLKFLDVPEPEPAIFAAMTAAEVQNKRAYPPMRADTRQLLEAFYQTFNKALQDMLGDTRWAWRRGPDEE